MRSHSEHILLVGLLLALAAVALAVSYRTNAGGILYGDANCDGHVNSVDSAVILQAGAGLVRSVPCPGNADVNGDGHINSLDGALILQYGAGLIDHLGPITNVPTATPTTSGCTITFASFYDEPDEFCGSVTGIQELTSIPGGVLFDPIDSPPGSSFAVVFMSVRNFGSAPDDVGIFSFRLRDASSRGFTDDYPGEFIAQLNAEDYFNRDGIYETIQPGLTRDIVVVFLVPNGTQGLLPERCPITGCEDNLPSAPPPGGCSLSVPDFYTDEDTVCMSGADIQFLTTIPASDFTDEVTAPPGSRFAIVLAHATNFSNGPTLVGDYSFRLRDAMSRIFTMDLLDNFDAQLGVEEYFGRHGSYETIQAGVSYEVAFLFLVPTDATGLFAQRCPPSGCA